jgi:hypothetical protein
MGTKTKTFDCVKMKNRIQAKIMAEYEAHKGDYPSFVDFIKARAAKSKLWKEFEAKIASAREIVKA